MKRDIYGIIVQDAKEDPSYQDESYPMDIRLNALFDGHMDHLYQSPTTGAEAAFVFRFIL